MIKSKIVLLLVAFLSLSFVTNKDQLSELRVFNRTILLVKEQYVDLNRLNPEKMLIGALEAMEKQIPELVVGKPRGGSIKIQIGGQSKDFPIKDVKSLWDLSFKTREIVRFIEPKLSLQAKKQEIEYAAVNGMLSQLDPHSTLLDPKFSKEMKLNTKGEFGGLGIVIGLREGLLTVIAPLDDTPADRAGIKALDQIIKIDDNSTINLALDEAVEKLRGKPGTGVSLTIQRKTETKPKTILIIRDIIKVESITAHLIDNKIGYVKIKSFHGNTSRDLRAAIDGFESKIRSNLKGLILDFRNNPGGLLNESVSVSDLFLDGGTVVVTQGAGGTQRDEEKASPGFEKTRLPLVVLVNSGSASASEIVAGALKNRGRAVVIGEQTFGKGSVQMLYDFPDKSALKLTIAQYLTPGDESIQSVGITPDILVLPAYVEAKNNLLLFPQTRMREGDLDLHLDDKKRVVSHKPIYTLTYVSEKISPEEQEKRAVSKAFHEDFEIRLAKRLLLQAQGATRKALLTDAGVLIPQIEKEENKKLVLALQKMGIDWSMPLQPSKKSNIVFRILGKSSSSAGGRLKISVEAKNVGAEPVYQVYGISKSDTPLLNDQEFIFGKLAAGQKQVWQAEVEIPKEMLTRQDFMRVSFKGNGGQGLGKLDVPLSVIGLPRPVLSYQYEISPVKLGVKSKIKIRVKNIGLGAAEEPIVLLKNVGDSDVFIEQGRQKLKPMKPGQTESAELIFTQRSKEPETELQLQIYDGATGEFWVDNIDLKSSKVISKVPPQIKWSFGPNTPLVSKDSYRIQAEITGSPDLKDAYLYVNDQKVGYQVASNKLIWNQVVALKPGLNYLTLVARAGENYGQRETITIFSQVGDPLAKNP